MRLEDVQPNAVVRGILPDQLVTVVSVQWFGSEALELTYKTPAGKVANELLYRHDEPRLELVELGRPWSFDGDGSLFRLVSEAHRIRLAHLFDPVLAVHTSNVDPLPHQITAVYESMLPRQPLRFLLADDPGAGKTIMAGLLIKELIARGDLQRCLIVCPGSLAEQWQDELFDRFQLPFEILTNDKLEAARTGNWFLETSLIIARLDKLSRNEDVQLKLQAPDCRWDLIVCDEAHKMSATVFGTETKYTKRYRLGQLLSTLTRHFLLMTATPHNGMDLGNASRECPVTQTDWQEALNRQDEHADVPAASPIRHRIHRLFFPAYHANVAEESVRVERLQRERFPTGVVAAAQAPSSKSSDGFDEAMMQVYLRAKNEAAYIASRFHQMLLEHGGAETARRLLPQMSDGFTQLWQRNRLDLTVESLILEPQWHDLFSDQERDIARCRLRECRATIR